MIHYLYASDLVHRPKLRSSMLRDRAAQFQSRLSWDVTVDDQGFETDEYDALNPLYVIWEDGGHHGGSMRFLPTTGDTMINDHFSHLIGGPIAAPSIWETTRFCVSPLAQCKELIAARLMMAGAQLGVGFGLSHAVAVFDARMERVYRRLGWSPEILGRSGQGREQVSAGLWGFDEDRLAGLCQAAKISRAQSQSWFERSFPVALPLCDALVA